jgi:HSP20 family protein
VPAADVYETEGEYVYELEVPGFVEKELAVEVTDHTLMVKGTRTVEKEETQRSFRLHERLAKEFERRFELPMEADTETISAKFANGVLELHAPKVRTTEPRKIAISAR